MDSERVRSQLGRILASEQFARARRSSQLLEFLVNSVLADNEASIKEYTIATQVFGRPESFDPRIDSLVRVEATRLRRRLESYYESAPDDPVEISFPAGSYVPVIRSRQTVPVAAEDPVAATPERVKRVPPARLFLAALGFAILLAGATVHQWATRSSEPRATLLDHVTLPGEVLSSPALSAGNQLYYSSNHGGGRFRIWRRQLGSDQAQPLTPPEWDSTDLDLSTDGAWLTYWAGRDGGGVYRRPSSGGPEELIAPFGLSPRHSADGQRILFWIRDPQTAFGRAYVSQLPRGKHEPLPVATEFMDAHNPQWTPDGRVLICGTLRSNVHSMEHDLWIVPTSGAAAPVKTGILSELQAQGIDPHIRPLRENSFRWSGAHLIFSAANQVNQIRLFGLPIDLAAGRAIGKARELIGQETGPQTSPSLRSGQILFATTTSVLQVWSLPLGADGAASADPARVTEGGGDRYLPSLSADGKRLVYLRSRPTDLQIWFRDLSAGVERQIYSGPTVNHARLSPDGRSVFFRMLDGPPPQKQQIRAIDLDTGAVRIVCDDCGAPMSISPRGEFVVHLTGSRLPRLAILRVTDGERREIIRHTFHGVPGAALSPDGKWIAFELDRGAEGRQIFVSPFRGLEPIAQTEWIAVTGPESSSFGPAWSADGGALYFLREGQHRARDIWMRRLGPTKQPTGQPLRVYEFANSGLTPLTHHLRDPLYRIGLSVIAGRALLTLSEMSGGIWIGRFDRP